MQTKTQTAPAKPAAATGGRLLSLDVFRGATIASMMLVNNPGTWDHVYKQLDHAEWNGWTFTDVIFPFFLWIVGVAIPLSTAKRLERGESRQTLFLHVLRRAAIIFGLGLFLAFFTFVTNGSYTKDGGLLPWLRDIVTTIRICGVLQRIAICYLIASAIYLSTKWRTQIAWLVGLLIGYWMLMKLWPAPRALPWTMTPEGNFSAFIDRLVLGKHTLHGNAWDPEGTVSTLPAIATCLFGILTGQLLQLKRSAERKLAALFVTGIALMFLGELMDIWLPINKNLWTSSYSVFMAGLAMFVFAICYLVVDVKGYQRWSKPFAIYGMNAISMFMFSGILGRIMLHAKSVDAKGHSQSWQSYFYQHLFNAPLSHLGLAPELCSLSWAIVYMLGLYLVAYLMYRQKWVIKF